MCDVLQQKHNLTFKRKRLASNVKLPMELSFKYLWKRVPVVFIALCYSHSVLALVRHFPSKIQHLVYIYKHLNCWLNVLVLAFSHRKISWNRFLIVHLIGRSFFTFFFFQLFEHLIRYCDINQRQSASFYYWPSIFDIDTVIPSSRHPVIMLEYHKSEIFI